MGEKNLEKSFLEEQQNQFENPSTKQIVDNFTEDCETYSHIMEKLNESPDLRSFENKDKLDKNMAIKLIDSGYSYAVAFNLENFNGLDIEIVRKLIESGYLSDIVRSLRKWNDGEIVNEVLKFQESLNVKEKIEILNFLRDNIDKLNGLSQNTAEVLGEWYLREDLDNTTRLEEIIGNHRESFVNLITEREVNMEEEIDPFCRVYDVYLVGELNKYYIGYEIVC